MSHLDAVILAAGQGKRMRSDLPKVLHPLGGKAMLEHVVEAVAQIGAGRTFVVYGHGGELVPESLSHLPVTWREQREQLGTGHAVEQAMPEISDQATVLLLYGDVPLVRPATLTAVASLASRDCLGLITVTLERPTGYGRVLRDEQGRVTGIVEEKDADESQRAIREINTGILAVQAAPLRRWLSRLDNSNAQQEFYLTDVIALAVQDGVAVKTVAAESADEVLGVNDRVQLAQLERRYQSREAERLMREGVTLRDPARFDIRGTVTSGRDVHIDVNVVLEGRVVLGDGVSIGPNNYIRDAEVGPGTRIFPNCVIEEATIGSECEVGPFSRLRPAARLAQRVHVGNFVEVKKSDVGAGSKINHLTYVGDSEVGRDVNVGAGTITCNYDGAYKHRTVIGDNAFIGSGVELVAPVVIGAGATVGAGSTITKNAPAEQLTLERSRQTTLKGWKRPKKQPK